MGFPLSRFQMLSGLCSRDEYVRESLAPFKLFCIVLHDPDDRRFTARMQRRFMDLHVRTGGNLLFVTFINPPSAWSRPEGLSFPEMEKRALSGERGFDSWLMVNHFLPVVAPDADLPCMLITHDLQSREYLLLESSLDQFETQLLELGLLSSSLERAIPVSDERVLADVSQMGRCQLMRLPDRSLAEELTDVLALQALGDETPGAEAWVNKRLNGLQDMNAGVGDEGVQSRHDKYETAVNIQRRKAKSSTARLSYSEMDDDECVSRSISPSKISHLSRDPKGGLPKLYDLYYIRPDSMRGYDLCDVRSRCNIMEYNRSLPLFIPKRCTDESKLLFMDKEKTVPMSFKQLAQPITEFFERELNRTLVQLMRWHSGIEMPEYYRIHKENVYKYVMSGNRRIYLNARSENGRLKRLTIGDAFHAYNAMCEQYKWFRMRDSMGEEFLQEWYEFFHIRNGVGHEDSYPDEFFGYDEFSRLHSVAMSLFVGYLWKMEAIGEALQKGTPLPEDEWKGSFFSGAE